MLLPVPRMMHEACIVKKSNGEIKLLVVGGKVGNDQTSSGYTNSVISYDMKWVLNPSLKEQMDPENNLPMPKWEAQNNMKCQRANFALIVLNNLVYVFGGI